MKKADEILGFHQGYIAVIPYGIAVMVLSRRRQ
jgi:hypothetical protein